MALLGREFIAVPDDRKDQIIFKWPDVNLRRGSRAIVDADELAVFLNKGQVAGTLDPGQHRIDANELPFLGIFIDHATGGNAYRAELYFVGTREHTGFTFGGRVDDVQDPQTGMIVTLRVYGDYSLKVADPMKLILNLVGTEDVRDNDGITAWMSDQLLKVMRTEVTRDILHNGWPILGLSAYTPELELTVVAAANVQLDTYGLTIVKMGNFDINLSDDDEATLKGLAKDTAYSRLAGGFQQYAAGEAMLGAGEGMSRGGGATGGALLATGLGVGQQVAQSASGATAAGAAAPPAAPGFAGGGQGFAAPGVTPAPAPPAVVCPACNTSNAAGAKFCSSCGAALDPAVTQCPQCQAEVAPGAKFCSSCGAGLESSSSAPAPPASP